MALTAEKVSKQFFRASGASNNFFAVRDADIVLEGGSVAALMGRSGSGKTTLSNILSGLMPPTTGKVFLDGVDLYALPDKELSLLRSRRIGVIPQSRAALDALTVKENILLPFLMQNTERSEAVLERAEGLMNRLGISQLANAMPGELSGGELRRLSIARALAQKPSVILADEPTGDLDDENTEIVLTLLREAAKDGAAVLLITHESDVLSYSDIVYRMADGRLLSADRASVPSFPQE